MVGDARLVAAALRGLFVLDPLERELREETVLQTKAGLGEAAFAAAWAEGGRMTSDEAVEYTLRALD
jgi:hypothetical protein